MEKPTKVRVAVFFDTNFLYAQDKKKLVSGFFKGLASKYSDAIDFGLFVPDTVLMELKYQAATEALEAVRFLWTKTEFLSELTRAKIEPCFGETKVPLTEDVVRISIEAAYGELFENYKIQVIPLPADCIDVRTAQKNSVNRLGVFETVRTGANGKVIEVGEKGFRDYLIQRTIEDFFINVTGYQRYVILTADKLLVTELAKLKSPDGKKVELISCQEEAHSFFNGIQTDVNTEWIKKLLPLAKRRFADFDDNSGLWFTEVKEKVIEQHGEEIRKLAPDQTLFDRNRDWQKTTAKWFVYSVQYDGKQGNTYTWTSVIEFCQNFSRPSPYYFPQQWPSVSALSIPRESTPLGVSPLDALAAASGSSCVGSSFVLLGSPLFQSTEVSMATLDFKVNWQADVSDQAEFSNLEILNIEQLNASHK